MKSCYSSLAVTGIPARGTHGPGITQQNSLVKLKLKET